MNDKPYWGYINTNYEWAAWLFVNQEPEVKLGPFETKTEAIEAARKYESSN
jgi:hypothetical protein|tara:strand:- start:359 stop:511 length:153 start_codon:yes stop_codon:yes gene_type:complete